MHAIVRSCARLVPAWQRWAAGAVLLGVSALSWATEAAPPQPEWTLTSDGAHLIQHSSRLIWTRCAAGLRWNGRHCVGQLLLLDHSAANALARQRARDEGVAWRLPHLKELQQLARLSQQSPGAGRATLPVASQGWSWSATAAIRMRSVNIYNYNNIAQGISGQNVNQLQFMHGWAVHTGTGEQRNDALRRAPMMVLLVRPAGD
ncbi:DUF1566 domain-containing protein [Hydrogenophaga sp.]|uniref:Lcl domain-containing protein n=1 Tax=Hydrogenophaga sp. TaxID=1904254 RepID=UPI0019B32E46|nr:DUF1566 domain-containing protein [Hydrogenophaga sp.]MBD3892699.1 DUF1566 domain-containing protein [Hydrogenophaga sp.]